MSPFSKRYITSLTGTLRKDFEMYVADQQMSQSEALRTCIKSHLQSKTSPDIQTRLRSIEIELRELNKKL